MKIDIKYELDSNGACWAKSFVEGNFVMSCGSTFKEARERHIKKIQESRERKKIVIPDPEVGVEV